MNWTNWRKLVNELETIDPATFDYRSDSEISLGQTCGCVAFHSRRAFGAAGRGADALRTFLGITMCEAGALYGTWCSDPTLSYGLAVEFAKKRHGHGSDFYYSPAGTTGIQIALAALDLLAARYGGEPASTFAGDEAAFLASVRAVAACPIPS